MSPVDIEVRIGGAEPIRSGQEMEIREQLREILNRSVELVLDHVEAGGEPADSLAALLREYSEVVGLAVINLAVLDVIHRTKGAQP